MKDYLAEKHSNRLKHTKAFLIFDWMAKMATDAAGGTSAVFGTKPGVAEYTPTDLGAEAKKAAASDISNMPEIQALLEKILPGYGEMVGQGSKNTLSLLRGEIPQDVQDQVRRTSAFRSLTGGFGGSGIAKSLTARDLGLTSLDLMGKGENSAQRWAGLTEGAVSPFSVTAKEQADQTMKNNLYKQATEQFKYNVLAAPDPGAAGLFNTIATIGGTAASFGVGSALGAIGGGKGSVPQQGVANYSYPSPTYTAGYPTSNASGTAPYNWPYSGWGG
jgi:hypothetical protein